MDGTAQPSHRQLCKYLKLATPAINSIEGVVGMGVFIDRAVFIVYVRDAEGLKNEKMKNMVLVVLHAAAPGVAVEFEINRFEYQ